MAQILVIDDEAAIREFLRDALEGEGYVVDAAADGEAGLRAFRAEPADVVLCDIFMPGKDGLETISALIREFPSARIIAMSGGRFGDLDLKKVAMLLGAVGALNKPFTLDELLSTVSEFVEP